MWFRIGKPGWHKPPWQRGDAILQADRMSSNFSAFLVKPSSSIQWTALPIRRLAIGLREPIDASIEPHSSHFGTR